MADRRDLPVAVRRAVLMEAGYRCAVPTCRMILAIDLHHMVEVSKNGSDDASNLLALCPSCHALYHRGTITSDAIFSWKGMLLALNQAFDLATIDLLLFLARPDTRRLRISGDGVLQFARLIAAGMAEPVSVVSLEPAADGLNVRTVEQYRMKLTNRGKLILEAWQAGDRPALIAALGQGAQP